ncbi:MAG: hypothetical protein DYG91_02130 [Chloroflexi bacterium CFX7]|nr:hypothetical protein [Chloroflexi bacterium CFX7]RIL01725.1 MAG: hypothetical protein DCC78_09835 [bacterium]
MVALLSMAGAACVGQAASPAGSPTGAAQPTASSTSPGSPASPTGTATATTSTPVPAGPAEHDGARTMAHLAHLTESIGPRVSGAAGEQAAIAYIRDQFAASGYSVEVLEFDFEGDRFQSATVRSGTTTIEALTLAGSKGGTASGRAVYVGLADAAGIAGRSLDGAIAIADRGSLLFADKYENVRAANAAGLIIINNQEGMFSGTLRKPAHFPVVGVADTAAANLKAAAASGAMVSIETPTVIDTPSANVLARPAAGDACQVLVGGHHDTVAATPGANDNGSGTATVLELARALAADGLDEGLCFATFGAEESGLHGSSALVQRLRTEGALPRYMVNLDVVGIGAGVAVIGSPEPVARAIKLASSLGIPALATELPSNYGSDHQSFRDAGVAVVFFTSGEFPTIHSPRDVLRDIDPAEVERIGDLAYATIRDLLAQVAQP